jgi:cardiolipin synthase
MVDPSATTRAILLIATSLLPFVAGLQTKPSCFETSHSKSLSCSPGSEHAIVELIASARHEVLVENEEMDDSEVTAALAADAKRGVRVVVVMTADSEWDRALDELATAGVEVRTHPDTESELYIHAKVVNVDPGTSTARGFVGSENFSVSSPVYNRELGIVTSDASVTAPLAAMVSADAAGGQAWR